MVILREKQWLEEMSIQAVSSMKDGLPFRVAVKSPDHQPPHAHVMDKETGKKELGQFKISPQPPRRPVDIEDYKKGITDEMRGYIFKWANERNKLLPEVTNWKFLNSVWLLNEKH
jgi:hypothetical protein